MSENRLRIAIVETDETLRKALSDIIGNQFPALPEIAEYSSCGNFFDKALGKLHFDLIFCNIQLGKKSGVKLMAEYKEWIDNVKLVFYCENMNRAPEIFETQPFGLVKVPFEKKRIREIIKRAIEQIEEETQYYIGLRNKHGVYCLNLKEVVLFESNAREVIVHHSERELKVYKKLDEVQEHIEDSKLFMRCHQSFLINIDYISEISDKKIVMKNGKEVPVARNRLGKIKDNFVIVNASIEM